MLRNINDLENWLRENKLEHWTASSREGGNNYVFQSETDFGFDENFSRFRSMMSYFHADRLYITATKTGTSRDAKNQYKAIFIKGDGNMPAYPMQVAGIGAAPPAGYISMSECQAMIDKKMQEFKIQRLQEEIKEKEEKIRELETPTREFIKKIEPYTAPLLGAIAQKFLGGAPAMTGIGTLDVNNPLNQNNMEHVELTEQEEARLLEAVEKWKAADPQWLDVLYRVANMAAVGNPLYMQFKPMLLNM